MHDSFLFKKTATLSLMVITIFLLISCDPGQMISIENQTNAEANIQFVFKKDKAYYVFEDLRKGDVLNVKLEASNQNSIKEFHFGIGHWKVMGSLDSLVAMVESIELKTINGTQTYKEKQQIQTFFEKRITGSRDEIIKIILE